VRRRGTLFVNVESPVIGVWDAGDDPDMGVFTLQPGTRLVLDGSPKVWEVLAHYRPHGLVLVRAIEDRS
jgi:hypothetical protein